MGAGNSEGPSLNNPVRRRGRNRFLLSEDVLADLATRFLQPPALVPDGNEEKFSTLLYEPFAIALEEEVLKCLTPTPELKAAWIEALPIALGSWARRELTPKSDLDILFAGSEVAAAAITKAAMEAGLGIRSRIPEDRADWSVGVEMFDVLALLTARPLVEGAHSLLSEQVQKLEAGLRSKRLKILTALRRERDDRQERSNSVAGFLEPNLKYGPGGLRDLQQALQLRSIFPLRFEDKERAHAAEVYEYYRRLFLICRAKSQLSLGGGDLLSAHEQPGLATWMGFPSSKEFMREIQKGLARVSFYADVDFAFVRATDADLKKLNRADLDFSLLASWLEKDPSILMQAKARDLGFKLYRQAMRGSASEKKSAQAALSRILFKSVDPREDDRLAIALFRSRWIDLAVTDFKKIVGYVQHDQYHRYTVDTHLLQAIREMKRVAARPTVLGRLKNLVKAMSAEDWKILGWSALYHDVGKGSGKEHSDRSVVIANLDFEKWNVPESLRSEIIWLIENHLELSVAAFRGNPASPATWRALHAKGVKGQRLSRLAIFTAVDILATNREAYTPWKERLLFDLVRNLEKPEAVQLAKLETKLRARSPLASKAKATGNWLAVLDRLDPFVVSGIPTSVLASDLEYVRNRMASTDVDVRICRVARDNRLWIRFHVSRDESGLFAKFARTLQAAGLSVRHASILSDLDIGVYDWFEVKPPREASVRALEAKLQSIVKTVSFQTAQSHESPLSVSPENRIFESVEALSQSDSEWVISFQGRDLRGALMQAAESLSHVGLSIQWAKVHTWGRQIDDVFGVTPHPNLKIATVLYRLKSRLGISQDATSED
jgi:[protein-PII] uridylyltransferase